MYVILALLWFYSDIMWNVLLWHRSRPSAKPQKLPVLLQYSAKQIIQSQIRIEFQFAGKTLQSPLCQYRAGFCSLWNRHSASLPCLGCGAQQYSRPPSSSSLHFIGACRCSSVNGFIHVLHSRDYVPLGAIKGSELHLILSTPLLSVNENKKNLTIIHC